MIASRAYLLLCIALAACEPAHGVERSALAAGPFYEIRIAESTIGANGHTKREVLVFGMKADGTYATDDVVLSMDRPAGAFTRDRLSLGALGATTHFIPCAETPLGSPCLGAATLTVALASDPATIVATTTIELVEPEHVSTTLPCQEPGITLYLDGNDHIRNGMLRVTAWETPYTEVNLSAAVPEEVIVRLRPDRDIQGSDWQVQVDTYALSDTNEPPVPLAVGIYENAQRSHFAELDRPGMAITGNGRACNAVDGRFEIHELVIGADLQRIVVTFEQRCTGSGQMVEGCLRYEKP